MRGKHAKQRAASTRVAADQEWQKAPCPACNHPVGMHLGGRCFRQLNGPPHGCLVCEELYRMMDSLHVAADWEFPDIPLPVAPLPTMEELLEETKPRWMK